MISLSKAEGRVKESLIYRSGELQASRTSDPAHSKRNITPVLNLGLVQSYEPYIEELN